MSGFFLAILATLSTYSYTTSQKLASKYLSPIYSMLISNAVVFILGAIILISLKISKQELLFDRRGIIFGIMVGTFATGIEILWVWAYSKNLSLINAAVITGVIGTFFTILSATLIFHEQITLMKIIALVLAILSGAILSLEK